MDNQKYLDSGEIVQFDDLQEEKYKLAKSNYKEEKHRLNKSLWNCRLHTYGKRICVITTAVTAGTMLFAASITKDNVIGGFGVATSLLSVEFGLFGEREDRHQEIKEIKEKKKVLKREYRKNK